MADHRPTAGEVLRRFSLGSGPLKRGSDRVQFAARILLVCSLLLTIPIALAVGTATHSQARLEAAAQAAERHRASARLVDDAPLSRAGSEGPPVTSQAEAVWTGPAGADEKGILTVPAGTKAGSTVRIWLDQDGHHVARPLSDDDVRARTVGHAVLTLLLLSSLEVAAYTSLRRALDRSRSRRWAAEWAAVGPRWSRQVS